MMFRQAMDRSSMDLDITQLFKFSDKVREFEPGEIIFAEGAKADCMYALIEGEVAISVKGFDVWQLKPGELFGEMALVDHKSRSATAIARSAARVAAIGERQFLVTVQQSPYFALHVMRLMASRLRVMDETLS
jgi:CRP-like cAMP-binding protein